MEQDRERAAALVVDGDQAVARGDLDAALESFAAAASVSPTCVDAYYRQSAVYLRRRDYANAIDVLARGAEVLARRVPPDDPTLAALKQSHAIARRRYGEPTF